MKWTEQCARHESVTCYVLRVTCYVLRVIDAQLNKCVHRLVQLASVTHTADNGEAFFMHLHLSPKVVPIVILVLDPNTPA